MFQSIRFLASTEIRHLLRRRETLLWTFVMPPIFMFFLGLIPGGYSGGASDEPVGLALVVEAEDGGFLLEELVTRLEAENFRVERRLDSATLESYRRRLTVPRSPNHSSFTEAVLAGEETILRFRRRGQGNFRDHDRLRVNRAVYTLLAELAAIQSDGDEPAPARFAALRQAPRFMKLTVKPAGKRKEIPSGLAQSIPGNLVMFTMMIMLTGGAITLVTEREQGLLRRLASTPITRGQLVAGKWLGQLALGVVQITFAVVAAVVLFGMDWGPHKLVLAVVLLAWAAFNMSLGMVLGNLARSESQMSGIGVIASLSLAALGGCWWPIEITPDWMQSLASALPTGWAMDSIHRLVSFQEGGGAILKQLLALVVGAVVLGVLAKRTFRYQ